MELRSVFLLLCVAAAAESHSEAGAIIFPGQLDHAEGDACPTINGETGICSRSCNGKLSLAGPRRCGIEKGEFLVCCNTRIDVIFGNYTDISRPRVLLQCGINTKKLFSSSGATQGGVLRPELLESRVLSSKISTVSRRSLKSSPRVPERGRPPIDHSQPGVGGVDARKNAWPWMALMGESTSHNIAWFCGGVLIDQWWVLTAAHCFLRRYPHVVRLGEHNYNDDNDGAFHEDFGVEDLILFPEYNFDEGYHDLALLRLSSRVNIKPHINPVCLPWGSESGTDMAGRDATLTGWGDTQYRGSPSSVLQEVHVTVFPTDQCDQSYSSLPHYPSTWPSGMGNETLCAGDPEGGRDACQGDSGGPLVTEGGDGHFILAGIISQGYGCGHKDYPGLYVNMRHPPYLAWIKQVVYPNQL